MKVVYQTCCGVDVHKFDMPEPLKNRQKEKAVKQAMKLLIAEGLIKESQLAS